MLDLFLLNADTYYGINSGVSGCPGPHMSERMCGRVSGLAIGWFQRGAPGVPNL